VAGVAGTQLAAPAAAGEPGGSERAAVLGALRTRLGLVALLLALAGAAWWATLARMAGMDAGPGADLGTLGWFAVTWVVMMAAMMLPSVAPTVALYARMTARRGVLHPLLFAAAYLLAWGGGGLLAYGVVTAGRDAGASALAWPRGGHWLAAGVVVLAAVYEVTPLKNACLARCRSPLGFLLGAWRSGRSGALRMGLRHAAWCVGCCWALMAALFALGIMSLTWMAVVAGLITVEKTVPRRTAVTAATAALLLALGAALALSPHAVPGLSTPGGMGMGMQ
jgi:predicted metal-binding membrane protein